MSYCCIGVNWTGLDCVEFHAKSKPQVLPNLNCIEMAELMGSCNPPTNLYIHELRGKVSLHHAPCHLSLLSPFPSPSPGPSPQPPIIQPPTCHLPKCLTNPSTDRATHTYRLPSLSQNAHANFPSGVWLFTRNRAVSFHSRFRGYAGEAAVAAAPAGRGMKSWSSP